MKQYGDSEKNGGRDFQSALNKKSHLDTVLAIILPFLLVISALLLKVTFNFVMDSDPLWSIGVGEWIHTNRAVPFVDVFSWTVAGEEWLSNSWLFCWLMYVMDQSLGYLGVALLIFIPCLVTGYFLFFMCKRFQDSTFTTLVFMTGIIILIIVAVTPRAYVYTFAFIAIIMYLIRFKRDTNLIYFIPLVFFIWANIQSSFRFGFGIVFIEALVGTIFYKDKRLWPIVVLSFLATLINPYGFSFWEFSLSGFLTPGTQFIAEWRAPDFSNLGWLFIYGIMFLTGLLGAFKIKEDMTSKIYDRDRIMLLFWFFAAFIYSLTTIRAIHYVLLLWAPLFSAFATKSPAESRFLKPLSYGLAVLIFITSLVVFLPDHTYEFDQEREGPVSFVSYLQDNEVLSETASTKIPSGAVKHLEDNPHLVDGLFNSYILGGYLLLREIDVFIDARESVFTRLGVTEDYFKIARLETKPEEIIVKYGINTFILSENERLIYYLDLHPEWEKDYEDDIAVIYKKVNLD